MRIKKVEYAEIDQHQTVINMILRSLVYVGHLTPSHFRQTPEDLLLERGYWSPSQDKLKFFDYVAFSETESADLQVYVDEYWDSNPSVAKNIELLITCIDQASDVGLELRLYFDEQPESFFKD